MARVPSRDPRGREAGDRRLLPRGTHGRAILRPRTGVCAGHTRPRDVEPRRRHGHGGNRKDDVRREGLRIVPRKTIPLLAPGPAVGYGLGPRLATFLRAMGRTELHSLLVGRGTKDLSSLEEPLAADLAGTSALIVFDDTQNASHEALMFLPLLQRALRRQKGTSGLILSRNVPPFYSRREVAVDGSIVEFALSGLDAESSELILADSGLAPSLRGGLVEASGGNPLFLRLLPSAGAP